MQAQIDQYLHFLRASLPEENAITSWSRWQAAYLLLAPLVQDLVAERASKAYVERVFSVCGSNPIQSTRFSAYTLNVTSGKTLM